MGSPTPRDLELMDCPTIASQMPLKFKSGSVWSDFKGECSCCGKELPDSCVRGKIVAQSEKKFSLEASGVCHDCRLLTRFVYRMHDDLRITGPRNNGDWVEWKPKLSLLNRFVNWFKTDKE